MEKDKKNNDIDLYPINPSQLSKDKLIKFINRLDRININVVLVSNYPWIYLDSINGKRIMDKFMSDYGFTIMFLPTRLDSPPAEFTDIKEIFKLIRKYRKTDVDH